LFIRGRGPALDFTRAYNSLAPESGPLGYGWTHNYNVRLAIDPADTPASEVTRVSEGGRSVIFVRNLDGSYARPPGVFETLVRNGDGTFTLSRKDQVKFNFTSMGKLQSVVDRNNNRVDLLYDGSGLLDRATDSDGRYLDFTNDPQARVRRIDEQLGDATFQNRYVEFFYDANGDLWRTRDVKGGFTEFTYENHRLKTIKDANLNTVTENFYDTRGRVVEQLDGEQKRTCIHYGVYPPLDSATCPTADVSPAPQYNQTVVMNPRRYKATYTSDTVGATSEVIDARGGRVTYNYEDPANPSTYCSDNSGEDRNLCSVTDQGDDQGVRHTTSFTYDTKGNLKSYKDAREKIWDYTYNTNNDILTETDPQQPFRRCTQYEYGDSKNLTKMIRYDRPCDDPSKVQVGQTTFGRHASGNGDLISITDGNNHTTSFTYDTYGLLDTVSDAIVPPDVTNHDFDVAGRLTCVIDAEGNQTKFDYDAQNNILKVHDAENTVFAPGTCTITGTDNFTEYTYDAKGNRKTVKNARQKTTSYVYDKMDRVTAVTEPIRAAIGPAETGSQCGYVGMGNALDNDSDTVADDGCASLAFTYDANGNVSTKLDSRTTALSDTETVATSSKINYGYDELDRLTSIGYPDSHLNVSLVYHPDGLRKTMTDGTGSTSYDYFVDHRLKKVTTPGGKVVEYDYDDVGNRKLVRYPDSAGDVTYTYDEFNRMKTVTDWLGDDPMPNVTTYQYDGAGNLDLTTTDVAGQTNDLIADAVWDNADRLELLTNKRGSTTLSSFDYTLDKVGNRTQIDTYMNGSTLGITEFGYDDLYRLTSVNYPDDPGIDDQTYQYDAVGNRDKMSQNGAWTTYLYDDADRITRSCPGTSCSPTTKGTFYGNEGNGALSYFGPNQNGNDLAADVGMAGVQANRFLLEDYDGRYLRIGHCYDQFELGEPNGIMRIADILAAVDAYFIDQGSAAYDERTDTWPQSGPNGQIRIADILVPVDQYFQDCAGTEHLVYNGDGLRVTRWVLPAGQALARTDYTWDVGGALPVVLQETTDGASTYYVYGLDLISTIKGSDATFHLYDGLGSTTGLANEPGNLVKTYQYDAFGAVRATTGIDEADTSFRFTGEQQDFEASQQPLYLRARYYDPGLGRFWSRDPVHGQGLNGQSWNSYRYAFNNPANVTDPSGLQEEPDPIPIPAPVSPDALDECGIAFADCIEYGRRRGVRDAHSICQTFYDECSGKGDELPTGYFDMDAAKREFGRRGFAESVIDAVGDAIGGVRLPKTGTGGYLESSKEGSFRKPPWIGCPHPVIAFLR
jgi:RHS repeat-associated protein